MVRQCCDISTSTERCDGDMLRGLREHVLVDKWLLRVDIHLTYVQLVVRAYSSSVAGHSALGIPCSSYV